MSSAYFDQPVLTGRYVRLEPLTLHHAEGLLEAGKDPGVWTWLSTRLGAQREGTLRNHKVMPDGSSRNTTVYSIIDSEWPTARDALRARLRQSAAANR